MKILILMPRQLGDVLLATTFISVLKEHHPTAEIHWWAHPLARGVLEGLPHLTQAHYWPVSLFSLRKLRFDVVIDSINYPKSSRVAFFTGAKTRISFRTNGFRDKVYTHLIERCDIDASGYLGHARLKLLEPLGIFLSPKDLKTINPFISLSEENYVKPRAWLGTLDNFIVISPTSRRSNRIYPIDKITDVAVGLIRDNIVSVVWSYGPGEEEFVSNVQKMMEKKLEKFHLPLTKSLVSPLFSLKEAAAFVSLSRGWIGNTNGMSHIAAAAGAKTFTLYGPSSPESWTHPDFSKHFVMRRNTGCVGCNNNTCGLPKQECFEDLEASVVLKCAQNHFFPLIGNSINRRIDFGP